jgi:putative transposase
MSRRFGKLSHVIWHCHYHIVWAPKYQYRVLIERAGFKVQKTIRIYSESLGCEIEELKVQADHVLLLAKVPPKISISKLMGTVKRKSMIQMFHQFPYLRME